MSPTLLTDAQFRTLCKLAHQKWGLDIQPGKLELVSGRIRQYLRANGGTAQAVIETVARGDDREVDLKVFDALSTNLTSFFREPAHFDCLRREIIEPARAKGRPQRLRIWSAACSKGCEPYSLGMVLRDSIPEIEGWDVKVLATDLARSVVKEARRGVYKKDLVTDLPAEIVSKHFTKGTGEAAGHYRIKPEVRKLVTFGLTNLTGPWHQRGPFDAIFCRNVMIYFDEATRDKLVTRMRGMLRPGGLLVLGSSEGLVDTPKSLTRVQPAVYRAA